MTTITFTYTVGGVDHEAWLYKSDINAGTTNRPTVLACPTTSTGTQVSLALIADLNAKGWDVACVHLKGAGGGDENYGWNFFLLPGFLDYLTANYGTATVVNLLGQSRGNLDALPFLKENPTRVNRTALIMPDMDQQKWPAPGSALNTAFGVPDNATWLSTYAARHTPLLLASAIDALNKEIHIWHGDSDTVIPKNQHTDPFAQNCRCDVTTIKTLTHEYYWNGDIVRWLTNQPLAFGGKAFVELELAADYVATTGVVHTVPFTVIRRDWRGNACDKDHDGTFDSMRFIADRDMVVDVDVQLYTTAAITDTFWPAVYVNGANGDGRLAGATAGRHENVSLRVFLRTNDYIEIKMFTAAAATLWKTPNITKAQIVEVE